MLLTEYNEKKYMKMFRKEAREEGLEEGLLQGLKEGAVKERNRLLNTMLQNGASAEDISKLTGLPLSKIEDARREAENTAENKFY